MRDAESIAAGLLAGLQSPDSWPHKLDPARALILQIRLDATTYRAASFLDDRILGPATQGVWLPIERLAAAAGALAGLRPLHFIFHTGHVGSTLLSRLLDATGAVLSLREPLPLRTLAELHDAPPPPAGTPPRGAARFDALLELFLQLWRRGYPGTGAVVLKATSSAARLGPVLLDAQPDTRAVYLNLHAEPWLATLLAGGSQADLRGHAPERLRRLAAQLNTPLPSLDQASAGELAALGWLAETLTQHELLQRHAGRVLAIDFDALLADIPRGMHAVLGHLGLPDDEVALGRVCRAEALGRYSKAPELQYDARLRAELLDASRRENAAELARGLRLLETLARTEVAVAQVLAADPAGLSPTTTSA